MAMSSSSILFLIFNRLDTASRVFEAIREARPSRLYIAADGPRLHKPKELEACLAVRNLATQVDWPCEVHTLFHNENLGCAKAVKGAIDWFFEHEEEGIILEDDCLPRPEFFSFCSAMLDRWRNNEEIMMISGTNYLFGQIIEEKYYFSKVPFIWGWATWRKAWKKYSFDVEKMRSETTFFSLFCYLKHLLMALWLSSELIPQNIYSLNSWYYYWLSTILYNKKYTISPTKNLITNIGELGAHGTTRSPFNYMPTQAMDISSLDHPATINWGQEYDFIAFKNIVNNTFPIKKFFILHTKSICKTLSVYKFFKKIKDRINISFKY